MPDRDNDKRQNQGGQDKGQEKQGPRKAQGGMGDKGTQGAPRTNDGDQHPGTRVDKK